MGIGCGRRLRMEMGAVDLGVRLSRVWGARRVVSSVTLIEKEELGVAMLGDWW